LIVCVCVFITGLGINESTEKTLKIELRTVSGLLCIVVGGFGQGVSVCIKSVECRVLDDVLVFKSSISTSEINKNITSLSLLEATKDIAAISPLTMPWAKGRALSARNLCDVQVSHTSDWSCASRVTHYTISPGRNSNEQRRE
jgi:hypothetical protein